jgi:hypothetical protein
MTVIHSGTDLQTRSSATPAGATAAGVTPTGATTPDHARAFPEAVRHRNPGADQPLTGPDPEDGDAHLLRLCLDLQLDALLLTLGAAAAYTEPGRRARGSAAGDGTPPWRRWLDEDVELAVTLASDARAGHATLPSTLGTELDHAVPATVVDNLDARFRSMRSLLIELTAQPDRDGPWRAGLQDALSRCEQRMAELRAHRLEVTPPRGITVPVDHHYLPGELLG